MHQSTTNKTRGQFWKYPIWILTLVSAIVIGLSLGFASQILQSRTSAQSGVSVSGFFLTDGTNYYIGPAMNQATLPVSASFSWLTTQGSATVGTVRSAIVLTSPASGGGD